MLTCALCSSNVLLVCRYLGEKMKAKYTPIKDDSAKNKAIWFVGAARSGLVVVLAAVVAYLVHIAHPSKDEEHHQYTFTLVKDVPKGLPTPSNPLKSSAGK